MLFLVWLSIVLLFAFLLLYIAGSLRSDERLPIEQLRTSFFAGVIVFFLAFIGFTWHTLRAMPGATHAAQLTPAVAHGKRTWQKYVCVECHTILGNGAYYASDLTKAWPRFVDRASGDEVAAQTAMVMFLQHPPQATRTMRGMPAFAMTTAEARSLVEFLRWTSKIDTNGWPPAPIGKPATAVVSIRRDSAGAQMFAQQGCTACHTIGGGRSQGPDLAGLVTRLDRDTVSAFIRNPETIYVREGRSPLNDGYPTMPAFELSQTDADAIADYLVGTRGQS